MGDEVGVFSSLGRDLVFFCRIRELVLPSLFFTSLPPPPAELVHFFNLSTPDDFSDTLVVFRLMYDSHLKDFKFSNMSFKSDFYSFLRKS